MPMAATSLFLIHIALAASVSMALKETSPMSKSSTSTWSRFIHGLADHHEGTNDIIIVGRDVATATVGYGLHLGDFGCQSLDLANLDLIIRDKRHELGCFKRKHQLTNSVNLN